jgi:pimeloyl-ACP methyl ester carboxylesterase
MPWPTSSNCSRAKPALARPQRPATEIAGDSTLSSPPIWLVAHSNGAVIALLVTQRLIARGMQVGGLILIGAACEADVIRNRVNSWLAQGSLRAAISYSSKEDQVLGNGPHDLKILRGSLGRWLWRHMIAPYGTLGSSGWMLRGQPASGPCLVTRWHAEGHSGLFAPGRMETTFECIYQEMPTFLGLHTVKGRAGLR